MAAEALEGSGSLRMQGLTGMWRKLGPGGEHGLAEGDIGLQEEETVNRQLNCLSLERGGGQEAEKSLQPLILSARTPGHDPLGNPVGPGPSPLLSMALRYPWCLPAAQTHTQSQTCTLLPSVHSVGGRRC